MIKMNFGEVAYHRQRRKKHMLYYVYIIQSEKTSRYYIGMTTDLAQRLRSHNSGANKSTKGRGPWNFVYKEEFYNKKDAWNRERQTKNYKGGEAFKKIIKHGEVA